MKRFSSLFVQDFMITIRNAFFYILVGLVVIILALVIFLPEQIDVRSSEFVYDASQEKVLETALLDAGMDAENIMGSEVEMLAALEESKKGIGIVFHGDLEKPAFTVYTEGSVAEENLNIVYAVLETMIAGLRGELPAEEIDVQLLREPSDPIPLNQNIVPIFLVFDAALLGYLISAVLIFQEKEEGTLRALRVTAMTPWHYILSKTALYTLMGLAYGALPVLAARGLAANYLHLAVIVALYSILMTLVGITIAVFFQNMSEWFFGGVLVLIVFLLPSFSYAIPSFAPQWVTWIPTYAVIFAVRDAMFFPGTAGGVWLSAVLLLAEIVVMLVLCYFAVSRKLLRNG